VIELHLRLRGAASPRGSTGEADRVSRVSCAWAGDRTILTSNVGFAAAAHHPAARSATTRQSLRSPRAVEPVPRPIHASRSEWDELVPRRAWIARQNVPGSNQAGQQVAPTTMAVGASSFAITQDPVTGLEVKSLVNKWRARP
jgi:hypothetical protein